MIVKVEPSVKVTACDIATTPVKNTLSFIVITPSPTTFPFIVVVPFIVISPEFVIKSVDNFPNTVFLFVVIVAPVLFVNLSIVVVPFVVTTLSFINFDIIVVPPVVNSPLFVNSFTVVLPNVVTVPVALFINSFTVVVPSRFTVISFVNDVISVLFDVSNNPVFSISVAFVFPFTLVNCNLPVFVNKL